MGRAEDLFDSIKQRGETAIIEFINTRKSEELFLDFKRSANNGNGRSLDHGDREQLARAISGFGNSEGGVVVWGVDCSNDENCADVARMMHPINDPVRFVSWLEGAITSCTVPPHQNVQNFAIAVNDNEGYAITYVPKSNHVPHQVILNGRYQYHYYIRAGSSFAPTPHSVLSGMFGRRPQPDVFPMFQVPPATMDDIRIKAKLGLLITNKGPGIATDVFINVTFQSIPGQGCRFEFTSTSNDWEGNSVFGIIFNYISKNTLRLAPGAILQPFILNFALVPPFENDLHISIECGSGQSEMYSMELRTDKNRLLDLYTVFQNRHLANSLSDADRHVLVQKLLSIPEDQMRE